MLDAPASVHLPNEAPHLQEHNFLPPQGGQPSRPQVVTPLRHHEGQSSHAQEGRPPRSPKKLKTTDGASSMPLRKGQHDENNVTDENGLEINWRGRDPENVWNKDIRKALEWHRDTHMPDMRAFTLYRSWQEGRGKEPLPHFQGLAFDKHRIRIPADGKTSLGQKMEPKGYHLIYGKPGEQAAMPGSHGSVITSQLQDPTSGGLGQYSTGASFREARNHPYYQAHPKAFMTDLSDLIKGVKHKRTPPTRKSRLTNLQQDQGQ
ncbi:hypothetical protein CBOM_06182 [Ceraceosorus bombacis]|uniref:Uncharacterized protein n=1 Tax=Ceraceosorus bombacis TaxID=401625 RepID=A0A0P1BJT2_9BASI|nr:hypothetical protein CBOM_06182 [Ceraceosorus bombacis]